VKTMPVLVQVNRWSVSICPVAVTASGPALDPNKNFRHLGTVAKGIRTNEKGYRETVWDWADAKLHGIGRTKTEAISNMLAANGFHQVSVEATIPDLLAGLEEGDTP
jgi:hypothetical protein